LFARLEHGKPWFNLSMNVIATKIPEVFIIEPKVFGDERGFFF
jgi:dTDP-4-dehydrorhamnose 3,5-epimerase